MATEILLPKLGFAVDGATLVEWLASDGAQVEQGQPLYLLDTDKAEQEIEAPASGRLRILKQPGESYPVGTVLGAIEDA